MTKQNAKIAPGGAGESPPPAAPEGDQVVQETPVKSFEQVVEENERLQREHARLETQLAAARWLLKDRWAEAQRLTIVFADSVDDADTPALEDLSDRLGGGGRSSSSTTPLDPLARYRSLLEGAPTEGIRRVAKVGAEMGRMTAKQLIAATPYKPSTVRRYIQWLVGHGVFSREGKEGILFNP